jgi:hypothetical protein
MASSLILTVIGAGLASLGTLHCVVNLVLMRKPIRNAHVTERISILIPARNEEHRLGPLLRSLQSQQGLADAQIVILDDSSTDATLTVIKQAAEQDNRISIIIGDHEPPPTWLGKPWACQRLLDQADGTALVFVDADVVLEPDAVASAVATMRSLELQLVSPYPKQLAITFTERLVQPLLQWSWLTTLPLRLSETSRRSSLSAANGQLLVVDAGVLSSVGGFSAVRGEVLDDIALLRQVKSVGGRGGVIDGSDLATCRMYTSRTELIDGYAKSLWSAFGGPFRSLLVNVLLLVTYVIPPVMMLWPTTSAGTRLWGLVGFIAGSIGRAMTAKATHSRVWPDSLWHPISILTFSWLSAVSWLRHVRGTLRWKDRPL